MIINEALISLAKWLLGLDRIYKRAFVVLIDAVICIASVVIAFSLRWGVWDFGSIPMARYTAIAIALWLPIFFLSNIYRAIFRFAGAGTLLSLAKATGIYAAVLIVTSAVVTITGVPRTIAILHPIIFFAGLALSRIVMRYILVDILNRHGYRGQHKNILIYGAGSAGQQLAASLRDEPSMHLVGFIDDNRNIAGQRLNGKPVHTGDALESLIKKYEVSDVLLAMPSIPKPVEKMIITKLSNIGVKVKKLPSLSNMVSGNITVSDLREISIEDLLGRSSVQADNMLMNDAVDGKIVLVTGAGGSIGGELCRQIMTCNPKQLILADVSELALYTIHQELRDAQPDDAVLQIIPQLVNVADKSQIARLFRKNTPDIVFHAAAYKHVPLVEANPLAGIRNNIFGTLNTVLEAEAVGVPNFILISTDKAVRPTNVMGTTKRTCELILQAIVARGSKTNFSMVRFGNVLGSSGSVVPRFMNQIKAGGPVTLTDKRITRYFMTIPEAAQLVVQAAGMAKGGEVFLLDMGASVRIIDLAKSMISLSGLSLRSKDNPDGDIEIVEIGLRPGEKLYEELLIGNSPKETDHKQIMKANENYVEWNILETMLIDLERELAEGHATPAVAQLKRIVPEFGDAQSHNGSI